MALDARLAHTEQIVKTLKFPKHLEYQYQILRMGQLTDPERADYQDKYDRLVAQGKHAAEEIGVFLQDRKDFIEEVKTNEQSISRKAYDTRGQIIGQAGTLKQDRFTRWSQTKQECMTIGQLFMQKENLTVNLDEEKFDQEWHNGMMDQITNFLQQLNDVRPPTFNVPKDDNDIPPDDQYYDSQTPRLKPSSYFSEKHDPILDFITQDHRQDMQKIEEQKDNLVESVTKGHLGDFARLEFLSQNGQKSFDSLRSTIRVSHGTDEQ
jgi:hypothetical protein